MPEQTLRRHRRHTTGAVVAAVAAAVIALLLNAPFLNSLIVSFKTEGDIAGDPLGFSSGPTLDHYLNVLYQAGYDFPRFFLNSILISLGAVLLVLIISVPASYAIIRLRFGGDAVVNAASGLRLLPAVFFIVPFFVMFNLVGLTDTVAGLVFANTFLNVPLALILLTGAIRELPIEVEEAAAVDGAGILATLWRIVIPMLAPTLVAVCVLVFIFSWDDYLFALVLSTSEATPVTLGAANFITSTGIRWGDISAAAVLSVIPPVLFAVFAQRYLVSGLSSGAVKG
ncbi:carbohydrate ABC transporter permease [Microbacterium arabinogalactanolyticum]|uniref:carbohydrate ABC transporter permease n=1 Tax=Microbacterium arabinogalactanolyticum TaxID=69365 RepID=UPI002554C972|nr:carbohydrate ABC transporter permease [Microbacterium arabinogalactanolyticum]GLC86683.1 ABC transporter permease [Microbacterium arabinogalactanolyticum]